MYRQSLIGTIEIDHNIADDVHQALYREQQLALHAIVGVRELDVFLSDKDVVAQEIEQAVRRRAGELGLSVVSVGIRDGPTYGRCPLPGDMKDLMNKVTEAEKAAAPRGYPNLISRREETAAMRSQAGHRRAALVRPSCWPTIRR